MTELLLIVGGFLLGSIPFSVLVGRLALKTDIRSYGDRNPGATNVFRAGGKLWGVYAIAADIGKGALPVGLAAQVYGLQGWTLIAAALTPVIGHAFSPWLGFKGGKAIATTYGIWIGLTVWHGLIVAPLLFLYWYLALRPPGYIVLVTGFSLTMYFALIGASWVVFAVLLLNFSLLTFKHRVEMRQGPRLRLSPLFKPLFRRLSLTMDTRA
jgi:glycerol-3-phosphate acyltransferase PlsY